MRRGFPGPYLRETPRTLAYFAGFNGQDPVEPLWAWEDGMEARKRHIELRRTKLNTKADYSNSMRLNIMRMR